MPNREDIDENMLGAFVDGQLDPAGCETVVEAMAQDPALRQQVERLRRAKDLMRIGFASATPPYSGSGVEPAATPATQRGFARAASPGEHKKGQLAKRVGVPAMRTDGKCEHTGFKLDFLVVHIEATVRAYIPHRRTLVGK